jgi:hypothetical protein
VVARLAFPTREFPGLGGDSRSASQEIPRLLWNTKVHYRVQSSLVVINQLRQLGIDRLEMSLINKKCRFGHSLSSLSK